MNTKHKYNEINFTNLVDYIYEAGLQKKVKRTGWWVAGVENPENIAEHSFRTSVLGYVLASMEGYDSSKVACMCILHDIPECRFNDGHKIAARYIDLKSAEKKAFNHQMQLLPAKVSAEFIEIFNEFEDGKTKEAVIAKDADYLECAFQAKEYYDIGFISTSDWIKNIEKKLVTKSARALLDIVKKRHSKEWYIALNMKDVKSESVLSTNTKIADFIFELGVLKNVKKTGFWVSGVKDPESVADHIQRASLITYIISMMEGLDVAYARESVMMSLFHDISEARLSDSHRIASNYLSPIDAKKQAFMHQMKLLPRSISEKIMITYNSYFTRDSKKCNYSSIVAKDGDMLEYAVQAREYYDLGYKSLSSWIKIYAKLIKTKSAVSILKKVGQRNSKTWFPSLKMIDLERQDS